MGVTIPIRTVHNRINSQVTCCVSLLACCALAQLAVAQAPLPTTPAATVVPEMTSPQEQAEILLFLQQHGGGIVLSEPLMQRIVGQETTDEGPLREQILGADVVGTQGTQARTVFDFVTQPSHAQWFVHLRGTTRNCTTSYTPQALIRSEGEYHFQLSKQVDFQGEALATRSPSAFLETRQRNIVAHTPADRIPLVGPLVGMAAFMEAEKRRPLAERIAAHRLTERIAPTFNSTVDESLAELNRSLSSARNRWPTTLETPPQLNSRSTEQFGAVAMATPSVLAQAAPNWPQVSPQGGVTLLISQERLNQILQRLPLAGQEIRDTDLDAVIRRLSGKSAASGPDLPGAAPSLSLATLLLDRTQPLTVEFLPGETVLELRAGLRPAGGVEIPAQRIRFHIQALPTEFEWTLSLTLEDITAVDPNLSDPAHILVRQVLKQHIESRLEPIRLPRDLPLPEKLRRPALQQLRLEVFDSNNGWLSARFMPQ